MFPADACETKFIAAQTLLMARQLNALDQPSNRDYQSVLNFMDNGGSQLYEEEMRFIREKEDLVTLKSGREQAWLERLVEDILRRSKVFKVGANTVILVKNSY